MTSLEKASKLQDALKVFEIGISSILNDLRVRLRDSPSVTYQGIYYIESPSTEDAIDSKLT